MTDYTIKVWSRIRRTGECIRHRSNHKAMHSKLRDSSSESEPHILSIKTSPSEDVMLTRRTFIFPSLALQTICNVNIFPSGDNLESSGQASVTLSISRQQPVKIKLMRGKTCNSGIIVALETGKNWCRGIFLSQYLKDPQCLILKNDDDIPPVINRFTKYDILTHILHNFRKQSCLSSQSWAGRRTSEKSNSPPALIRWEWLCQRKISH